MSDIEGALSDLEIVFIVSSLLPQGACFREHCFSPVLHFGEVEQQCCESIRAVRRSRVEVVSRAF